MCNTNSINTTMKMLGVSQLQWVLHALAKFNNRCAKFCANVAALFTHHLDAKVDEIIPVRAWDFTNVWNELSCWHLFNSQLLLRLENDINRHCYDEEYKAMMIADVQHQHSNHKSVGKAIADATHKTSV